jgi:hypothetical protein
MEAALAMFKMESWFVAEGKDEEHKAAVRDWFEWIIWEYDSLADFEAYKERRGEYEGSYEEYKVHDPYYKRVFEHGSMRIELWKDLDRDLWIE